MQQFVMFCNSLFTQVEYKYDKEMLKGCVIPVVDDKLTLLCMKNAEMASDVSHPLLYVKLLKGTENKATSGCFV